MDNGVKIAISVEGTKATCVLEGKLTAKTSPELMAELEKLDTAICDFDIDLSKVSYVASAGLRVLVGLEKLATRRGGTMRILDPQEAIMEIFALTGLESVFVIERTAKRADS